MRHYRYSAGFTYLGLLLLIAIAGIGIAAIGQVWHTEIQREKEKELLFIGDQFRQAIGSYYESTPSGAKQYPLTLEELVHDNRSPKVKHHLRRIYSDPMTGQAGWGLEKQEGRIVGIYSLSEQHPLKTAGFEPQYASFSGAREYRAWRFIDATAGVSVNAANGSGAVTSNPPNVAPANAANGNGAVTSSPPKTNSVTDPTSSQKDASQEQACREQRLGDISACASYCGDQNIGRPCGRCRASIFARFNACLLGSAIPPLGGAD